MLPAPLRGWLRLAGPYGRATVLWGAGERDAALAALAASPRRLAAFSLAADQPQPRPQLWPGCPERRPGPSPPWPRAWPGGQGRLTEALSALDGARGLRSPPPARTTLAAEQALLARPVAAAQGQSMITASFGA